MLWHLSSLCSTGIALFLSDAIYQIRESPPIDWSASAYRLILRPDLAYQAGIPSNVESIQAYESTTHKDCSSWCEIESGMLTSLSNCLLVIWNFKRRKLTIPVSWFTWKCWAIDVKNVNIDHRITYYLLSCSPSSFWCCYFLLFRFWQIYETKKKKKKLKAVWKMFEFFTVLHYNVVHTWKFRDNVSYVSRWHDKVRGEEGVVSID